MKIQFNEEQQDAIESQLLKLLPHGSGIDCKWEFEWNNDCNMIKCMNSFHCMTEHGYYDGYADFSVTLYPIKALTAFRFQFHGKVSHYKNQRYLLRDYLEDTFYHALSGNESLYSLSLDKS